jgi:hypothetical protein
MTEAESAVLIKRLRRAKRRWKALALTLSLVLTLFVAAIGLAFSFLGEVAYFPGIGFFPLR